MNGQDATRRESQGFTPSSNTCRAERGVVPPYWLARTLASHTHEHKSKLLKTIMVIGFDNK